MPSTGPRGGPKFVVADLLEAMARLPVEVSRQTLKGATGWNGQFAPMLGEARRLGLVEERARSLSLSPLGAERVGVVVADDGVSWRSVAGEPVRDWPKGLALLETDASGDGPGILDRIVSPDPGPEDVALAAEQAEEDAARPNDLGIGNRAGRIGLSLGNKVHVSGLRLLGSTTPGFPATTEEPTCPICRGRPLGKWTVCLWCLRSSFDDLLRP